MRRGWTQDEDNYLIANYADSTPQELEDYLKRSRPSIYQRATALGLKKSAHYFATAAAGRFGDGTKNNGHRFKPGHAPWNRGFRGWYAEGAEKPGSKKAREARPPYPSAPCASARTDCCNARSAMTRGQTASDGAAFTNWYGWRQTAQCHPATS